MIRSIIRTILVLLLLIWLIPAVSFADWMTIGISAVVLTLMFNLVRPILKLLFLPINIITIGLFSSFINVFLLWATSVLVPGFIIGDLVLFGYQLHYLVTLIVISILISMLNSAVKIFI